MVHTSLDDCGSYLKMAEEDSSRYDMILGHGLLLAAFDGCYETAQYLLQQETPVNTQNLVNTRFLLHHIRKLCKRDVTGVCGGRVCSGSVCGAGVYGCGVCGGGVYGGGVCGGGVYIARCAGVA